MALDIVAVTATGPSIGGPATFFPSARAADEGGAQFAALLDAQSGVDEQSARQDDAPNDGAPEAVPELLAVIDLARPTVDLPVEAVASGSNAARVCKFRSEKEATEAVASAADRDEAEAESAVLAAFGSLLPPTVALVSMDQPCNTLVGSPRADEAVWTAAAGQAATDGNDEPSPLQLQAATADGEETAPPSERPPEATPPSGLPAEERVARPSAVRTTKGDRTTKAIRRTQEDRHEERLAHTRRGLDETTFARSWRAAVPSSRGADQVAAPVEGDVTFSARARGSIATADSLQAGASKAALAAIAGLISAPAGAAAPGPAPAQTDGPASLSAILQSSGAVSQPETAAAAIGPDVASGSSDATVEPAVEARAVSVPAPFLKAVTIVPDRPAAPDRRIVRELGRISILRNSDKGAPAADVANIQSGGRTSVDSGTEITPTWRADDRPATQQDDPSRPSADDVLGRARFRPVAARPLSTPDSASFTTAVIAAPPLVGASLSRPVTSGSDSGAIAPARAAQVLQGVAFVDTPIGPPTASKAGGAVTSQALEEAHLDRQIVQAIRLQWRDSSGRAVVTLEPEYLGALTISLHVEGNAVSATLHAENPHVRAWIEANAPALAKGLSDQGLSLDRLLIADDRPTDAHDHARPRRQRPAQLPFKPGRRADASTFEIVV